jgi:hypothetical protein
MKPKDVFGLVVRTVGLALVPWSLWYLMWAVLSVAHPEKQDGPYDWTWLFQGVVWGALALGLLYGAPYLVRFSYRDRSDDKSAGDA